MRYAITFETRIRELDDEGNLCKAIHERSVQVVVEAANPREATEKFGEALQTLVDNAHVLGS